MLHPHGLFPSQLLQHHPAEYEVFFMEDCKKAFGHDTALWDAVGTLFQMIDD